MPAMSRSVACTMPSNRPIFSPAPSSTAASSSLWLSLASEYTSGRPGSRISSLHRQHAGGRRQWRRALSQRHPGLFRRSSSRLSGHRQHLRHELAPVGGHRRQGHGQPGPDLHRRDLSRRLEHAPDSQHPSRSSTCCCRTTASAKSMRRTRSPMATPPGPRMERMPPTPGRAGTASRSTTSWSRAPTASGGRWPTIPPTRISAFSTVSATPMTAPRRFPTTEPVAHTMKWIGPALEKYTDAGGATDQTRLVWGSEAPVFQDKGKVFYLTRNNMRTDVYLGQVSDDNGMPLLTGLTDAEKKDAARLPEHRSALPAGDPGLLHRRPQLHR